MLKTLSIGLAVAATLGTANAQVALTVETASPGSSPHYVDSTLAAVLESAGVASLQITEGATLTNSVQAIAEGRLDMSAAPLILPFLLSKGAGPYSGLGAEEGKKLSDNLRAIFFHAGSHQIFAHYNSSKVQGLGDLAGKRIWNGPPRGAALASGRAMIDLLSGLKDGTDYEGVQTPWPDAVTAVTSGSVDAWTSPDSLPSGRQIRIAAAGGITIYDVPKDLLASQKGQQILKAPGHRLVSFPVEKYRASYEGNDVTIVTDDDTFDTFATAFGEVVNVNMDEQLVYDIVAAYLKAEERFATGSPIGPNMNMTFGDITGVDQGACGAVPLKMHAGAIRAYEDAGFTIADCLKP